jgi:hypothetical protein
MKNLIKILTILAFVFMMSCSDEFLDENPPHIQTAETIYKTVEGFDAGINGLYSLVRRERESYQGAGRTSGLTATLMFTGTDNVYSNSKSQLAELSYDWNLNNPNATGLYEVFLWLYQTINAANTIINRAENPDLEWTSVSNKNRIVGEARAIRAWCYRHLTYLWGDVPLNLQESSGSNIITDFERTPIARIRRQMINDWKFAAEHLESEPSIQGRMTRGVPLTYLAEMYLAIGKPDSALIWADECINDPAYELIENRYNFVSGEQGVPFMDMFKPGNSRRSDGNKESLWTFQWEINVSGGGENLMRRELGGKYDRWDYDSDQGGGSRLAITEKRGGKGLGYILPTSYALALYASSSEGNKQDERGSEFALKRFFILSPGDIISPEINLYYERPWQIGDTIWCGGRFGRGTPAGIPELSGGYKLDTLNLNDQRNKNDWPYSLKWAQADPGLPVARGQHNDQVYMRLAETILLKAEALYRTGRSSEAAVEINKLRNRANAVNITAEDIDLDFILDERSRELLMEEHRRYTLLRYGGNVFYERTKVNNFDKGLCTNFTESDSLLAIPQEVIDANLTIPMPQNPDF